MIRSQGTHSLNFCKANYSENANALLTAAGQNCSPYFTIRDDTITLMEDRREIKAIKAYSEFEMGFWIVSLAQSDPKGDPKDRASSARSAVTRT